MARFLTMEGAWERALYNSWLLIFPNQWKQKYIFISIFILKLFDGISDFQDALHPKATGTNHVFYLVMPHEIKRASSKKGQSRLQYHLLTLIYTVRSMVIKCLMKMLFTLSKTEITLFELTLNKRCFSAKQ